MNSIADPNRTEAPNAAALVESGRTAVAALILTLLLISFTPYQSAAGAAGGNLVNQLGYASLAAAAILAHVLFTDPRVILSFLRPAWICLVAALLLAVNNSAAPNDSLRAVLFTFVVMIAVTGALCLPTSAERFRLVLAIASAGVLGLSYFGVLAWPHLAVHSGAGFEPQHAGLWRGIYSHKNVAGPVMAMLVFVGFYLYRGGARWSGIAIGCLAALFVLKTGSKTTLALTPVVMAIVVGGRVVGGRLLPALAVLCALAFAGLFTLGAAAFAPVDHILQAVAPGVTFTGRMDLWRFAMDLLSPHAWEGFGPETFWLTDIVLKAEKPFELSWDMREIVNSHSTYLELALWGGWPLVVVGLLAVVVAPLTDYVRAPRDGEPRLLADLCLMILAFALLNGFLEAFLFNRSNPVWVMTWLAVVGLHLSRRFRVE